MKLDTAILHILDNNHEAPIFSTKELGLESDIKDFLEKHLTKIFEDPDLKNAFFTPGENFVFNICRCLSQNEISLTDASFQLTNRLFAIMKEHVDIPSADVVFCKFDTDTDKYLAIIKFNYKNSYIHYVLNDEEGNVNTLVKQRTTLPTENQKVEECVLIDLSNLELKVLEKAYEINGEKDFYLSKYFLECESELSYSQKIKIIDKAVNKLNRKHFNEDFNRVAQLKTCVVKSLEEENEIRVDKVAEVVFGDDHQVKSEYIEEVKKAGLTENTISIADINRANKKYATQKLKTDSGIEINLPSHFYENKDIIEFINNPDGTISILIKNVTKLMNK